MNRIPPVILVIVIACCVVELLINAAMLLGLPASRYLAFGFGAFWSDLLWGAKPLYPGQPLLMFATYGFLHSGLLHLGMNMLSLVALAPQLGMVFDGRRLALIYAVSQLAAAGLFAVMAPTAGPMIGASGAVFGMAGALIGFAARRSLQRSLPMGPLLRSAGMILLLNLGLTLMVPSIAWEAHLGGALAGLAMGLAQARSGWRRPHR